jgi:hypothetical protein
VVCGVGCAVCGVGSVRHAVWGVVYVLCVRVAGRRVGCSAYATGSVG